MKIRHVRQQHQMGCGVACLAMVLGIDYDEAHDLFHSRLWPDHNFSVDGMPIVCFDTLLAEQGFAVLRRWRYSNDPEWPRPFAPVHVCNTMGARGTHLVVMDAAGVVFDPYSDDRRRLADYPHVYDVTGVFRVIESDAADASPTICYKDRHDQR